MKKLLTLSFLIAALVSTTSFAVPPNNIPGLTPLQNQVLNDFYTVGEHVTSLCVQPYASCLSTCSKAPNDYGAYAVKWCILRTYFKNDVDEKSFVNDLRKVNQSNYDKAYNACVIEMNQANAPIVDKGTANYMACEPLCRQCTPDS